MEHGKLVIAHFSLETNNNEHAVKVKQSHLGSVGLCADSRKAEKHNGGKKKIWEPLPKIAVFWNCQLMRSMCTLFLVSRLIHHNSNSLRNPAMIRTHLTGQDTGLSIASGEWIAQCSAVCAHHTHKVKSWTECDRVCSWAWWWERRFWTFTAPAGKWKIGGFNSSAWLGKWLYSTDGRKSVRKREWTVEICAGGKGATKSKAGTNEGSNKGRWQTVKKKKKKRR